MDIPRVLKQGRRIHSPGFTVVYRKGSTPSGKFRFIVSTKVDKRAVVRNRLRRILSESVQHVMKNAVLPLDMVIIAKKDLVEASQLEAETRIRTVFMSLGLSDGNAVSL